MPVFDLPILLVRLAEAMGILGRSPGRASVGWRGPRCVWGAGVGFSDLGFSCRGRVWVSAISGGGPGKGEGEFAGAPVAGRPGRSEAERLKSRRGFD